MTLINGYGAHPKGKYTVSIRQERDRWHWVREENYGARRVWVGRESFASRREAERAALDIARCYDAYIDLPPQ